MRTFHFLDAVCLFVVAAFILLETENSDASPKPSNTKLKNKGSTSSGNAKPKADASPKPSNTKLKNKGPTSSGNAKPNADASPKTSSNTKLENEPAEQENPGLTVDNKWNSKADACHPHLTLSVQPSGSKLSKSKKQPSDSTPSDPRYLVVKHNEEISRFSSVFAVKPIPKTGAGIFYYEVTILKKAMNSFISIGLCPKEMPLDSEIGAIKGTYAFQSCGFFAAGPDALHTVDRNGIKIPFISAGNTVGCGVDLKKNNALFYTLNGERLGPTGKVIDSAGDLFPCVSLSRDGDEIKANFGAKFQYSTADGI